MVAVIYKFDIKENTFPIFLKYWKEMTNLIHKYEKGLGSRLHKQDETTYIAYAQWPDKITWSNAGRSLPEKAIQIRNEMRKVCNNITVLHELEVVADLLIEENKKE